MRMHFLLMVITTTLAVSAAAAQPCPPGFFSIDGQAPCIPCPANTFNPVTGARECLPCMSHGTSPPGSAQCQCELGYFIGQHGECLECPGGSNCGDGASLCPPGTTSPTGFSPCTPCSAGTFQPAYGAVACVPCYAGSANSGEGATLCAPCGTGTYAASPGQATCNPCAPGTHAPSTGAVACLNCPANTFANGIGTAVCSDCPAGSASFPGSTGCLNCPGAMVFLTQPISVNAAPGGIFDLMVDLPNPPPGYNVTLQWRHNAAPVPPEGRILGITTHHLTVTDAVIADSGAYDILVTWAPCPTERSEPAGVYIGAPTCPGDADGDGRVTFADITSVLSNFNTMCR